jgi:xanthine dehydrogenase YagT iron-sulfur-binding subunit
MKPISRRRFHQLAASALFFLSSFEKADAGTPQEFRVSGASFKLLKLQINGKSHSITVDTRTTLLDLVRNRLGLTGTKKGCDHGQCGSCTVLINGVRIKSCLALAIMHENDSITTIEGLASGDQLHPMQEAFLQHDGFQCGYCTPGQIMSAVGLLKEPCGASNADVRECMSGNICRCGAYPNIISAIQEVRQRG